MYELGVRRNVARNHERHIPERAQDRVELLRLLDGAHVVREAPEKEADDNRAPELRHQVEDAEGP